MNLALRPPETSRRTAETSLFAALFPLVDAYRTRGLEYFWFVRKDPGLRLRFGGKVIVHSFRSQLDEQLALLRRTGSLERWFPSPYEPELFLLGGPQAITAVHRYFDRDTAAWRAWQDLPAASRRVTSAVLTFGVLQDLFESFGMPREEVWDVWSNLRRLYRDVPEQSTGAVAVRLADVARLCGPGFDQLARDYATANRELAESLNSIWRAGRLWLGIRALLPRVAAFHWNRYRVSLASIAETSAIAERAYNPGRGLIGTIP